MHIFIPSLGRSDPNFIHAGPLPQVPDELIHMVSYVVPTNEVAEYHETLAQMGLTHRGVSVVGCKEIGISGTRRWIGEVTRDLSASHHFMMMDDDVRFVKRASHAATNLVDFDASGQDFVEMYNAVDEALNTYAHVGVSPRQGNNRHGLVESVENTRTLRVLAYDANVFCRMEHGRVPVMEDFDVNLQLLRKGYPNLNFVKWSQDQKMTNAEGGCSTYRDHEKQDKAARKLSELHPGFVKVREKKNKTDKDGFGTRTDVTIYWKKAYASSQK